MAIVWTKQIEQETFTEGYADKGSSGAVVVGVVTGLTDNTSATVTARSTAITAEGGFHAGDTKLPLQVARVDTLTGTSCRVVLVYGRSSSSAPTLAAFASAHESIVGESEDIIWTVLADNESETIGATTLNHDDIYYTKKRVPIWRISVPTVLTSHPNSSISALYGTSNSDAFTINTVERAIDTLLFDGAAVQPIDTYTGVVYVVRYLFLWKPTGWLTARPYRSSTAVAVSGYTAPWYERNWTLINSTIYTSVAYLTAGTPKFPVHTP